MAPCLLEDIEIMPNTLDLKTNQNKKNIKKTHLTSGMRTWTLENKLHCRCICFIFFSLIDLDEFISKCKIISSQGSFQIHCRSRGLTLSWESSSPSFTSYCTCFKQQLQQRNIMVLLDGRPRRFFKPMLQTEVVITQTNHLSLFRLWEKEEN